MKMRLDSSEKGNVATRTRMAMPLAENIAFTGGGGQRVAIKE